MIPSREQPIGDPSSRHAVMLCPSAGLGGGIERYAEGLESAFATHDVPHLRFDLRSPGIASHRNLYFTARMALRGVRPQRIVTLHRSLLPVASILAHRYDCAITVICHGNEVWTSPRSARRLAEDLLLRRDDVRIVAASSFTAGTLFSYGSAAILPPGLPHDWFSILLDANAASIHADDEVRIVTTFRLSDWRQKGLPELLSAIVMLDNPAVKLAICGSGQPTDELRRALAPHRFATLRPGLTDAELAAEFASADLFVLATRTVRGRNAYGEGYGLVLAEAQLAGTPVVAPAFGGSHDTFSPGVTGVAPADESADSLADALWSMIQDRQSLIAMGKRASEWARDRFDPDNYAERAVAALL